jgi:hypothetical protein
MGVGRKVLFEVRENITLAEGSLTALVKISKQGKTSWFRKVTHEKQSPRVAARSILGSQDEP